MCGIAGWVDYNQDLREKTNITNNMLKTLERRGPDASGIYNDDNVCLLHRRLIVIDPDKGKQPMKYGNYTITYNGELYNTDEIRKELTSRGYEFDGHCDTEVLLKAYVCWGKECLDKLNGIYAFAIWNSNDKTLFMARDRMGVKPFFYHPYFGGIIFGSEIKTLLENPIVSHEVDEEGLSEIFLLGPGRTPGKGVIKGIKELKPAEFATFGKDGLKIKKYWSVKAMEHTDNLKQTIEKTQFLILDAIKRQLVSDMPLCCFLSGGLDSSIISKVAADDYKEKNKGLLTTYSVNYTDNEKYFKKSAFQPNSDMIYINMMVDAINSEHKEVVLDNFALANALDEATYARDLPGMTDIDSSLLLFCREVKKGYTVAISGECADEIFGGYPWYHNKDILFEDCFPWSRSVDLRKSILRQDLLKNCDEYAYSKYKDTINNTDKLPSDTAVDARMREMFMLNINWFMQTLLDRKDRMSMYNGLEVRVPFCDHRIAEYAYNMPWKFKSLDGREKGIVREAMKDYLPEEIVYRKKSPYPKTHNPIYMQLVSDKVKTILNDKNSLASQIINHKTVLDIIDNPSSISSPWYGQLMGAPQILAYIMQIDFWFNKYNINISK